MSGLDRLGGWLRGGPAEPSEPGNVPGLVGRGSYRLGAGGKHPDAPDPFEEGKCDCSGFLAWCFALPRKSDEGVWFYTDQLEADARGEVRGDLGDGVAWDDRQPGDLIVYGAGPRVGHCGILSGVDTVIHCQASTHPAVTETGLMLFERKGAVVLRMRRP